MKVEIKPPYVPFSQHEWCCVSAVLQMIMYRRGIKLMSQEDIGYELGLIVPRKDKKMFNRVRTGKRPSGGYGTRIYIKKYSINSFFKRHKIKLVKNHVYTEDLKEAKKLIISNIKKGNDLIICFNYRKLYKTGHSTGHVSLISSFDTKKNIVTLIDPAEIVPEYRKVSLKKLLDTIKYHGKSNWGGFWVVKSR
ncbi:MAG: hypothetical protein JSV92_00180 [archaeon]|nr:MAG: hypothetical protein JSV92_00180 [archaeon]